MDFWEFFGNFQLIFCRNVATCFDLEDMDYIYVYVFIHIYIFNQLHFERYIQNCKDNSMY